MSKGMIFFMNIPVLQIRIKLYDYVNAKPFCNISKTLSKTTGEFDLYVGHIEFLALTKNSKFESGNSLLLI